ncbi:MAG: isopenicillin N synthase family oxygenase [Acidimicrobiales bacterium]|nr:isopenicillin N synthase family oxygenase [Hyphomonadaceae bacterium]RZV41969.1 MAG: isopenicillin N synthase family oxygenase [Acidimicrobiales bacterium]
MAETTTLSKKKLPELSLNSYINGSDDEKNAFATALNDSLIEFGFVIIKDQDLVTPELIADAYKISAEFYAKPVEEKRKYINSGGGHRGYTAFGTEHAKDNATPDLKEFWHVGQLNPPKDGDHSYYEDNIWPDQDGFKPVFTAMYKGLEDMGLIMLEALASQIDPGNDYLPDMAKNGNSILRILHYPPIGKDTIPNAVRAAAHEDINLITLLIAANGRGLQLLTRDNEWLEVETDPENVIVDAGDMLAHITGGKIPSTTHRVVNAGDLTQSRYSIPFFMHPRPDSVLRPIDGFCDNPEDVEVITAKESLERRLKAIGLMK